MFPSKWQDIKGYKSRPALSSDVWTVILVARIRVWLDGNDELDRQEAVPISLAGWYSRLRDVLLYVLWFTIDYTRKVFDGGWCWTLAYSIGNMMNDLSYCGQNDQYVKQLMWLGVCWFPRKCEVDSTTWIWFLVLKMGYLSHEMNLLLLVQTVQVSVAVLWFLRSFHNGVSLQSNLERFQIGLRGVFEYKQYQASTSVGSRWNADVTRGTYIWYVTVLYNPSLLPFKAGGYSLGDTAKYTAKARYMLPPFRPSRRCGSAVR